VIQVTLTMSLAQKGPSEIADKIVNRKRVANANLRTLARQGRLFANRQVGGNTRTEFVFTVRKEEERVGLTFPVARDFLRAAYRPRSKISGFEPILKTCWNRVKSN
jgi:hypothetical protein